MDHDRHVERVGIRLRLSERAGDVQPLLTLDLEVDAGGAVGDVTAGLLAAAVARTASSGPAVVAYEVDDLELAGGTLAALAGTHDCPRKRSALSMRSRSARAWSRSTMPFPLGAVPRPPSLRARGRGDAG